MKVVILCGGKGTRLREETEFKPKPLVEIGGMPILWHIMKLYSHYGFKEFILCLGYKGEMIKQYFMNYEWMANDFTLNLKNRSEFVTYFRHDIEDWKITFADTGQESLTARRIKLVEKYIDTETFLLTYGDGVGNIEISKLIKFHKEKGKKITLTGTHPVSKYGILEIEKDMITGFKEKPVLKDLINAGFMVVQKDVLKEIDLKNNDMFEQTLLPSLAEKNELTVYKHSGYWNCMDTYRDFLVLNEVWSKGNAPWKIWGGD